MRGLVAAAAAGALACAVAAGASSAVALHAAFFSAGAPVDGADPAAGVLAVDELERRIAESPPTLLLKLRVPAATSTERALLFAPQVNFRAVAGAAVADLERLVAGGADPVGPGDVRIYFPPAAAAAGEARQSATADGSAADGFAADFVLSGFNVADSTETAAAAPAASAAAATSAPVRRLASSESPAQDEALLKASLITAACGPALERDLAAAAAIAAAVPRLQAPASLSALLAADFHAAADCYLRHAEAPADVDAAVAVIYAALEPAVRAADAALVLFYEGGGGGQTAAPATAGAEAATDARLKLRAGLGPDASPALIAELEQLLKIAPGGIRSGELGVTGSDKVAGSGASEDPATAGRRATVGRRATASRRRLQQTTNDNTVPKSFVCALCIVLVLAVVAALLPLWNLSVIDDPVINTKLFTGAGAGAPAAH